MAVTPPQSFDERDECFDDQFRGRTRLRGKQGQKRDREPMEEEGREGYSQGHDIQRRRLDLSATRQPVFRPPSPDDSRSRKRSPSPVRRQTQSLRDTGQPRVIIETGNIRAEENTVARQLWRRLRDAANTAVLPTKLQVRLCIGISRLDSVKLTATLGTDGGRRGVQLLVRRIYYFTGQRHHAPV